MPESSYNKSFYREQAGRSEKSADRVVPEILTLVSPASVVDVGCGIGTWTKVFISNGVEDVLGIDGSYVDQSSLLVNATSFLALDIREQLVLPRTFGLAVSLEVAEHLPPVRARSFVSDLCKLAPVVLFSAAIPGQGGTDHLNEQWPTYWAALFKENEFVVVERFGERFWFDSGVGAEYAQNMIIYAHPSAFSTNPALRSLHDASGRLVDRVHPHYYSNVGLKQIIKILPNAIRMALRRRIDRGAGRVSTKPANAA